MWSIYIYIEYYVSRFKQALRAQTRPKGRAAPLPSGPQAADPPPELPRPLHQPLACLVATVFCRWYPLRW